MVTMHSVVPLKVHYYGTPVVLVSSLNSDGTTNLAPISSAWWLGQQAAIGLGASSRTVENLLRHPECVLNLVPSSLVDRIDRLALLTGSPSMSDHKRATGYRYEPRKFEVAGLTPQPSDLVQPDRVLECPIQLEARVHAHHAVDPGGSALAIHVTTVRAHVDDSVRLPGTDYVDPQRWDPLIMKFCDFFGAATPLTPSRLAAGWRMPGRNARVGTAG